MKTNDPTVIAFIEALLKEADIGYLVLDQHMSILEGSLGIIPRRILVEDEMVNRARVILKDAGLGHELEPH
ncbi:MAG: DUF2007 domain-containing protein [Pseudomonadota bacterium]